MREGDAIICPLCGKSGPLKRVEKQEDVSVRGTMVSVAKIVRKCESCDHEYENTKDHDWRRVAFDKYRAIAGIPSADGIKSWREEHNLTQAEASNLLGWGAATIGRYEKGSLPTVAQAEQLKRIMSDEGLLERLEGKSSCVDEGKVASLIEKLKEGAQKNLFVKITESIHSTPNQNLNGGCGFSFEKLASLARILCEGGETKTKLNKLFFYADFCSKKETGCSITGLQYARIDYGPVPERYNTLYEALKVHNVIAIKEDCSSGYQSTVISPGVASYDGCLSDSEKEIAIAVRDYFKSYNATQIANYSHQEKAWIEVRNSESIPYSYAAELKNTEEILGSL